MEVSPSSATVLTDSAEVVVIAVASDQPLSGPAAEIDRASGGLLARLIERGEISDKVGDVAPLWEVPGAAAKLVVVTGLGDRLDRQTAFRSAASAARWLAARKRGSAAFYLGEGWSDELTEAAVAGAIVGAHGQDLYRAEKTRHPIPKLSFSGSSEAVECGRILGEAVNLARRLVNEPPQSMFPASFAELAAEIAQTCGMECEVWDENRLEAERAGALLAVAKGSDQPPRLVIMRYQGAAAGQAPLALVGKGVTFDSGGLSIKPSDSMATMKCDMAGAATVLGAMQAIAQLNLPVNVIGLMGLVENMPGGAAMKLGDVLTARSGKTIEVLNTDAEGRLVLADVLNVAVEQGAGRIIDLATLTGACVVALGMDVAGLMTNDQGWCDTVSAAAQACGEDAWQLPMFDDYSKQIRSEVADIKNVGEGRWGGAITAAKFLEEFVEGKPWLHIDIAGPAFLEKPKPWQDGGGSGAFVRTLVEVVRRLA